MSTVPENLRYTESHEWVGKQDDGTVRVGITDHAQAALGDLVYVELPAVGDEFDQGDACAVVESVKSASDINTPVAGEVMEVNTGLADSPEKVNDSPYEDGWIFRLKLTGEPDASAMLNAAQYAALIGES